MSNPAAGRSGRAGAALLALVALSTGLRTWAALGVPSPWITPDEETYAALGRSLWHSGHLDVLGHPAGYLSLAYPALVGLPLSLHDPRLGYDLAKALQALVMSLAAVPVYLWGRAFLPRPLALAAAALTVAVPGLAYSGFLMTETLFYPVLVLAAWAMAATLQRPTRRNQLLLLAVLGLAVATRLQAVVLVPAFVLALGLYGLLRRDLRSLRRFVPTLAGIAIAAAAWLALSLGRGRSPLGAYGVTGSTSYSVPEGLLYTVYHLGDLVLMTALLPVVALVLVVVHEARRRQASPAAHAFLAVTLSLVAALSLEVGFFTSRLLGRLGERYLIGLSPLLFLAFALWLARGAPRPRVATGAALAASLGLLALLPTRLFSQAAEPDAFSAIPIYHLQSAQGSIDSRLILLIGAAELAAMLVLVPRRFAAGLLGAALAVLAAASLYASRVVSDQARAFQATMIGSDPSWVDAAAQGPVAFLYNGEQGWSGGSPVWVTAFWNRRIERVYVLGGARIYGPLPAEAATLDAGGTLHVGPGEAAPPAEVVAGSDVTLAGTRVATAPGGAWTLWRLAAAGAG